MVPTQLSLDNTESELFLPRALFGELERPNLTTTQRLKCLIPRFSANLSGYITIAIFNTALCVLVLTWNKASCGSSISEQEHYYCKHNRCRQGERAPF